MFSQFYQFHWSFFTKESWSLQTSHLNQEGPWKLLEVFASSGQTVGTSCPHFAWDYEEQDLIKQIFENQNSPRQTGVEAGDSQEEGNSRGTQG